MGKDGHAPLLSVVVPVYRVEEHLSACLDSILAEVDDRIEVVAVNDGSPDRCGEILESYVRHDARMRVVHLPSNSGLGQARNAGLDRATGTYVWFVDGDDELPPGSLPSVAERLTTTHPDVLIIKHAEVFDDGRVVRPQPDSVLEEVSEPIQLSQCPDLLSAAQSACTKVVRREFLDEIELRFAPGWYEDSSFSHPLLMAAKRIDVLDRVCYHYHQRHAAGITKTVSERHFEVFDQYGRLFDNHAFPVANFEPFRRHMFRLMIDHYLVIVGNDNRVPPHRRREFFYRMAADYRARLPEGGYDLPAGVAGLKHWLVRLGAYRTYVVLRRGHRLLWHVANTLGLDLRPSPGTAAAVPRQRLGRRTARGTASGRPAPGQKRSAAPPR